MNVAVFPEITVWLAGCVVIDGATVALVTVSTAALLVALPALLLTATVNCALLLAAVSAGVVYVEEVAPLIAAPFMLHWYAIGAVPVAATLKVAVWPAVIFALAGCEVMAGATDVLLEVPVPLSETHILWPFPRIICSVPEKVCAADGLKVTEPVKVWPAAKLTGKEGPEKEN
jgi:hypothetical protein